VSDESREYKDSALSRIYREGAWPEPSRQIDEAILAASRRAARERWPLLWRWGPPFAVAATVVVTGSLVLMHREKPDVGQFSYSDATVTVADKSAVPSGAETIEKKEKAAPAPPAPPPAPVVTTPQGYTSTMDTAEAERIARAQRDLGLKQGPPPSESPVSGPAAKAALAENYMLQREAREPKRSEAAQRQPEIQASNARPAPQPAGTTTLSVFGAPPPAQAQATAPTPAPAAPAFAPLQAKVQAQSALRPAPEATPPPSAANELARTAGATERSPLTWLDDVRKLKAEGKADEAARELAEFRKRYPEYPLPNDLR
jgi:hypothetical protein